MMKRHKTLWLIVALAMIFTTQIGFEAEGARYPYVSKFNIYNGSICADAILKRLGYVYNTALDFSIYNLDVWYKTDNPAGNSPTAEGVAHIGDRTLSATVTIDPAIITHNGTAEVIGTEDDLCIDDDVIKSAVESAVLPNPGWTLTDYNLLSFDASFVIYEDGTSSYTLDVYCVPGEGDYWNCSEY